MLRMQVFIKSYQSGSMLSRSVNSNEVSSCLIKSISFFKKKSQTSSEDTSDSANAEVMKEYQYDETPPLPPKTHYLPPADVPQTILSIARKVSDDPSVSLKTEFGDNATKFEILTKCIAEFDFQIPSYELAELKSVGDVVTYYSLPRQPVSEEDKLKNSDLPKNLHLQLEPVRFTEDTKSFFKDKTAFPQRDTIVTSLKYRNIYKGYQNPKIYTKKKGYSYF